MEGWSDKLEKNDCYGMLSIKAKGVESLKSKQVVKHYKEESQARMRTVMWSKICKWSCKLNQIYITCWNSLTIVSALNPLE